MSSVEVFLEAAADRAGAVRCFPHRNVTSEPLKLRMLHPLLELFLAPFAVAELAHIRCSLYILYYGRCGKCGGSRKATSMLSTMDGIKSSVKELALNFPGRNTNWTPELDDKKFKVPAIPKKNPEEEYSEDNPIDPYLFNERDPPITKHKCWKFEVNKHT